MSNLVVTRRPGEAVMIGQDVVVTLLSINGNQARISINAPAEMAVDREEIRLRKDKGMPPPQTGVVLGKQYGERTLHVRRD